MRKWPILLLPVVVATVPFLPSAATSLGHVLERSAPAQAAQPWSDVQSALQNTAPFFGAERAQRGSTSHSSRSSQGNSALEQVYTKATPAAMRVNVGQSGIGSGFFLTSDGLVLTAAHVALADPGAGLSVTTDDGDDHPADLVGYDEIRDLALLRVKGSGFTALKLTASTPKVGDGVVAIGNSRGAFDGGRAGRVTALNASLDATFPSGLVASSMPLAPGDSGGPVLNAQGEVVGVSTAISSLNGQFSSYFVPLTGASQIVKDLRAGVQRGVPVIGVSIADASQYTQGRGVLVTDVTAGLGGQKAGLRRPQLRNFLDDSGQSRQQVISADVIVGIDGRRVTEPTELVTYLRTKKAGDQVKLRVQRSGQTVTLSVKLSAKRAG